MCAAKPGSGCWSSCGPFMSTLIGCTSSVSLKTTRALEHTNTISRSFDGSIHDAWICATKDESLNPIVTNTTSWTGDDARSLEPVHETHAGLRCGISARTIEMSWLARSHSAETSVRNGPRFVRLQ
eukprot:Amastigsp_a409_226.p4 type:complete len:126 gc:universal Amastigsp_a409_226:266-643(+)